MRTHLKLGILIAWLTGPGVAWAQEPSPQENPDISVSLYWSETGLIPGGQIALAVVLDIPTPYHVNAHTAKNGYIPTTVRVVNLPASVHSSTALFPEPSRIEFGPDAELIEVFSGRTTVYVPMAASAGARPGSYEVEVQVGFQPCDDTICYFATSDLYPIELQLLGPGASAEQINAEIFAPMASLRERLNIPFFGWDFSIDPSRLWLLLIVAAVGGFLLNLTPCVLPLIPIKIMSLSKAAGDRRRCLLLGTAMAAGVVAFWLGLALAISTISGFNATNKLFQYPAFTIMVGVVICAMALGMCGLFVVNLPQWIYRINPSQESAPGSFGFGIMAAVLSTPCTAPFMGAAAAWSATRSPVITLTTFAAIGLGMAAPYLILSAFPALVHRMPRTGPASELIKHVMGLLMLAAGAYFLGTGIAGLLVTPPDPPTQLYWWPVAFFIVASGGWLGWRTYHITQKRAQRIFFGSVAILLILLGTAIGVGFTKGSPIHWIYYTPQRLAQAQTEHKIIVLEFTASWCLNCHALEKAVLHQPQIVARLNSADVIPIKIDLTGNNPDGSDKLVEVGRRAIPYLIVYSQTGEELFASDAYTIDQLAQAIDRAR